MLNVFKMDEKSREQIEQWDDLNNAGVDKGLWMDYLDMLYYLDATSLKSYFNKMLDRKSILGDRYAYVVKNSSGLPVSFVILDLRVRDGVCDVVIQAIATHPRKQRKGYARRLLKEVLTKAYNLASFSELKMGTMQTLVDPNNIKSLSMFDSLAKFDKCNFIGTYQLLSTDFKNLEDELYTASDLSILRK